MSYKRATTDAPHPSDKEIVEAQDQLLDFIDKYIASDRGVKIYSKSTNEEIPDHPLHRLLVNSSSSTRAEDVVSATHNLIDELLKAPPFNRFDQFLSWLESLLSRIRLRVKKEAVPPKEKT